MFCNSIEKTTEPEPTKYFPEPSNSTHRQYEALRAYFVEGPGSKEAARRSGYSEGGFRVLIHAFRQDPDRQFFLSSAKECRREPKRNAVRDRVIALSKENLSIYDMSRVLKRKSRQLSPVSTFFILKNEDIIVRFQKRARNPLLTAPGLEKISTPIPWLGGKNLKFIFG